MSTRVVHPNLTVEPDIEERATIRAAIWTDGSQVATVASGQQLVELGMRHQLVGTAHWWTAHVFTLVTPNVKVDLRAPEPRSGSFRGGARSMKILGGFLLGPHHLVLVDPPHHRLLPKI